MSCFGSGNLFMDPDLALENITDPDQGYKKE